MAAPGDEQEVVKRFNELFGPAHFVRKLFFFGTLDFSLDGILVQALEELLEARRKIEFVKVKRFARLEFISQICSRTQWAKFQVFAMLPRAFAHEAIH